ncbi:hypothetical protein KHQ06_28180 [Nocardia tengchongensis]|uniref:Uncharacterized protein n=1 Tax=Nocardia tengchongensis TaxID=2055889 RepID=A0ABX8CJG8_9NOCA|nr:hypothetical protein [Nocardia tengchongensis]QVI20106.1 hypothetical protein KHQ06_28180 [Nocardia tengchongensis]
MSSHFAVSLPPAPGHLETGNDYKRNLACTMTVNGLAWTSEQTPTTTGGEGPRWP